MPSGPSSRTRKTRPAGASTTNWVSGCEPIFSALAWPRRTSSSACATATESAGSLMLVATTPSGPKTHSLVDIGRDVEHLRECGFNLLLHQRLRSQRSGDPLPTSPSLPPGPNPQTRGAAAAAGAPGGSAAAAAAPNGRGAGRRRPVVVSLLHHAAHAAHAARHAAASPSFSGLSATMTSVVRMFLAMEAAFCRAERVTMAGSMMPRLDHVFVLAGGDVEAHALGAGLDLVHHDRAFQAGVVGDLAERFLERAGHDADAGQLVTLSFDGEDGRDQRAPGPRRRRGRCLLREPREWRSGRLQRGVSSL